jgi:hypothetical protein
MPFYDRQEKGKAITIKDEGVPIATNVGSLNFTGAGVSGTAIGSDVTEDIPGGGGPGGGVTEVVAGPGVSVDNTDPAKPVVSAITESLVIAYSVAL